MNRRRCGIGQTRSRGCSGPACEQAADLKSRHSNVVFVDIETAGLEIHRPIIQLAAMAVEEEFHEVEHFETKIRFDESEACPDALRKNHYRRAEWKRTAVAPRKAAWSFARFLVCISRERP